MAQPAWREDFKMPCLESVLKDEALAGDEEVKKSRLEARQRGYRTIDTGSRWLPKK
jgi:hypothetical protein